MTANAMASDREDCLAAGMQEHVGKPFDLHQLVQTLLRVSGFTPGSGSVVVADAATATAPDRVVAPVAGGDGLDVAAALARMGGLRKLYLRSTQDFLLSLPEQLAQLRSALETDSAHCGMLAHTLKGTAATLGANRLSQAASQLEVQCQDPLSVAPRRAALDALQQVAAQAAQGLQQAVQAMQPAADVPAAVQMPAPGPDRERLRVELEPLMQLLQAQDLSALELFAQMREALARLPAALFDPLDSALQDLELELALQACLSIVSWLEASPA
jgi:HPt (histidine-containing phosphotransfer) domain-containing protein